eukprot:TRINITY_DN4238_c0_g1_i1.p1 TRINITY_DN4238_c0_g1~~TRINITY_DN4238_c0_g1_i1.p1  ORF type:complete len:124 (+),score=23.36 TRINITY_DN4238_c0_g1_i1:86-457(+)
MSIRAYRQTLAASNPPCVPFFGIYQTDLTFIEDGNADYLKVEDGRNDIINFDKMKKLAAVIRDIQQYQQKPYNFQKVPVIYAYLESVEKLDYLNEEQLYSLSLKVEPKVSSKNSKTKVKKAKK